jgi:23S rRNA pseudouridine1911/1915/1917 synthase
MSRVDAKEGKHPGERFRVAAPTTLEAALRAHMPGASRRTLKQLVEHRRVRVDGRLATRLDAALSAGATIEVAPRGAATGEPPPLPTGLAVVYRDDEVLVVEKPAGMLTIATEREKRRTAYAHMREHVKAIDSRSKLFIVHRLDRLTSGLLVFALSNAAKDRLQRDFAGRTVDRGYTAVVEGSLANAEGELRSFLVESSAHKVHVTDDKKLGVEAVTRYRVLRRGRAHTLVDVRLVTGRKAQIRVQFADAGHPVVGDRIYGSGSNPIGRLALHASSLAFTHPTTGRRLTFRSRAPHAFAQLVSED